MQLFFEGVKSLMSAEILMLMVAGVIAGLTFGAIPGLSVTMAMVLFLPFTYSMDLNTSIAVLMALYIGGNSGGLISAILIGIPGTAASVGTIFDGYPMTKRGLGGKALGIGVLVSSLGTFFSIVIMIFLAPPVARMALKFGFFETFAIGLFSMTLVAGLAGKTMTKGIISALVGLSLTMVGMAPIDSAMRFTFGLNELSGGFNMLPVLVGIYAIPELIKAAKESRQIRYENKETNRMRGFGFTLREFIGQKWNMLRSGLIGVFIGILPGIGGATSNMLAYAAAKNSSKYPEKFGTGIIDGVVATETANNASIGGAMIPLLTLGIPGDTSTAILLGAFLIYGIQAGPLLFKANADVVYCIFAAMVIAAVMTVLIETFGMPGFVKLMTLPRQILLPVVIMFCMVGSFAANNRLFDCWILLPLGIVGYLLDAYGFPLPPLILGFVLGGMVETNLRRALQISHNNLLVFFQRPITAVFLAAALLVIAYNIYKTVRKSRMRTQKLN